MKLIARLFAAVGVSALGASSFANSADAASESLQRVRQACESALEENTIEALEEFFNRYPPQKYKRSVACYAQALTAINEFGRRPDNDDRVTPPGPSGGYGS